MKAVSAAGWSLTSAPGRLRGEAREMISSVGCCGVNAASRVSLSTSLAGRLSGEEETGAV